MMEMKAAAFKIYTLEDVATHSKRGNCWVVHDNKIYNVRPILAPATSATIGGTALTVRIQRRSRISCRTIREGTI